ncbi:MAG: ATP-binding protein [Candidatus Omnitrophica bacterium]|nr:ATP-binding protein [Candidatus Omnitrophota bacterium]
MVKETISKNIQNLDKFKARRMIEAFRYGIVPYDCVEDFTFGREQEIQKLMDWLINDEKIILILEGEYGTGKTHLLNYLYWRALYEDFVVAYADIDLSDSPFNKPKRVYAKLIQSFKFRSKSDGQFKGFRDFLNEALKKGVFEDHRYFRYLIKGPQDEDREDIWDWIEGQGGIRPPGYSPFFPTMYEYSNAYNIYCYLLSALGWASKEVFKYKGFLLIFDEAETIWFDIRNLIKGLKFLEALCQTAKNDPELLKPPSWSNLWSNRCYKYSNYIPFIYKKPSGLKLLFAFTEFTSFFTQFGEFPQPLKLKSLEEKVLKEVFEHIYQLYTKAYNFDIKDSKLKEMIFNKVKKEILRNGVTRFFIKGPVEALDLIRHNPEENLENILNE